MLTRSELRSIIEELYAALEPSRSGQRVTLSGQLGTNGERYARMDRISGPRVQSEDGTEAIHALGVRVYEQAKDMVEKLQTTMSKCPKAWRIEANKREIAELEAMLAQLPKRGGIEK